MGHAVAGAQAGFALCRHPVRGSHDIRSRLNEQFCLRDVKYAIRGKASKDSVQLAVGKRPGSHPVVSGQGLGKDKSAVIEVSSLFRSCHGVQPAAQSSTKNCSRQQPHIFLEGFPNNIKNQGPGHVSAWVVEEPLSEKAIPPADRTTPRRDPSTVGRSAVYYTAADDSANVPE